MKHGKQTKLSLKFFNIGDEQFPIEAIKVMLQIKKSAALANMQNKKISYKKGSQITKAIDYLLKDKYLTKHFPLKIFQTGSATQFHMNINEVIAKKSKTHPNDDVNLGQSSNDIIPTMMNIVVYLEYLKLRKTLIALEKSFKHKSIQYKKIIKLGRTHYQDATALTLGQEFSSYSYLLKKTIKNLDYLSKDLKFLALGGTAVGTGLNSNESTNKLILKNINQKFKAKFKLSPNKFSSLSNHQNIASFLGEINSLVASLHKMVNDFRFLSSGPRGGIGELVLPANEPGSSIMPGKVNPTQLEALSMVCVQIMGNYQTVVTANSFGHLQLNVYKPIILKNTLESLKILNQSLLSFNKYCLKDLKPNLTNIDKNLNNSLMSATILNPILGYDKVAKIVKYALEKDLTLEQVVVNEFKLLTKKQFNKIVNYKKMI
jgi:fumarate hydratase class II